MCDKFITNLHQPQSTLMMLTAAFAKKDFILQAYEEAIKKKYRFYSYGDSMIII
jgi:S-adenosylmethionine:tRNA ribosyltransferase-isomerase